MRGQPHHSSDDVAVVADSGISPMSQRGGMAALNGRFSPARVIFLAVSDYPRLVPQYNIDEAKLTLSQHLCSP